MLKVKQFNVTKDHSTPEDSAGLSSGFTPLTRRRVWLKATEQISLKKKKGLHLTFPFQWVFLSFFLKFSSKRFQIRMSFFIIGSHSKSGG